MMQQGTDSPTTVDDLALQGPAFRRRIVVNTAAQFVSPAIRLALGLALAAVLARYLGVAGLGEYATVFVYVALIRGTLVDWGLGQIVLRDLSQFAERRRSTLTSALWLQLTISVLAYGLLLGALAVVDVSDTVRIATAVYGLIILLSPIDTWALPFQADLRLSRLVGPATAGALLHFTFSLAVVTLGGNLIALSAAALAALAAQYSWIGLLAWHAGPEIGAPSTDGWRRYMAEAWSLGVARLLATVHQQAPAVGLSLLSPHALGLFNAASRVPQQLILLPLAVGSSIFPLMSRMWARDPRRFGQFVGTFAQASVVAGIPIAIVGLALAQPIVDLLFGSAFVAASAPFALLLLATAVLVPGIVAAEALTAAGQQRINLVAQIMAVPFMLATLSILVPPLGALGGALAVFLSSAFLSIGTAVGLWRRLGPVDPLRASVSGLVAVIFGVLAVAAVWTAGPLASAIAGGLVAFVITSMAWRVPHWVEGRRVGAASEASR